MVTRPLENARWGFESNCFVCEPRNAAGLRIPFEHDDEAGVVLAVLDGKGRVCAEARATFTPLGPAQAVDAIGVELTAEDARYVRGPDGG